MSRIPSPARSAGCNTPPRRYLKVPRTSRSVCSPRSTKNTRLSAVIHDVMGEEQSFLPLSPMNSRGSFLSDNTDVLEPRRKSWWKKLGENTAEDMVHFQMTKVHNTYNILEEYEQVETNSQEDKNYNLDLPESSGSESIGSIVVPQRRLFTQKESRPQNILTNLIENRDHVTKHFKTPKEVTKTLEAVASTSKPHKSRPVFPAALLSISATSVNKSKELPNLELKAQGKKLFGNRATNKKSLFSNLKMVDSEDDVTRTEPEPRPRNLFGNRNTIKRTNMFTDLIATESDNEIPDVQSRVFTFQKSDKYAPKRRVSLTLHGTKEPYSPSSSVASDTEFNNWKMLPSSTMVEESTPAKRPRLNKLSEQKESEDTNKSTGVNKGSNTSQNKSTQSKTNRTEAAIENNDEMEIFPSERSRIKNMNETMKNEKLTENNEPGSNKSGGIMDNVEQLESDAESVIEKVNEESEHEQQIEIGEESEDDNPSVLNYEKQINNDTDNGEYEQQMEIGEEPEDDNPSVDNGEKQMNNDTDNGEHEQQMEIGEESGEEDNPSVDNDDEQVNNDTDNGEHEQQIEIGEESGEDDNPSVDNDEEHVNHDTEIDNQSEHNEKDHAETTGDQSVLEDDILEANQLKEMENTSDCVNENYDTDNDNQSEHDENDYAENTGSQSVLEDEILEANQLKEMENTSNCINESDGDNENYIENKLQYSNEAEKTDDSNAKVENEVIAEETDDEDDLSKLTKSTKRHTSKLKSPEVVLLNKTNFNYSYEPGTSDITNRKTNLTFKNKPTLLPIRDSIENQSDGTKNSTSEGSGWDSHRTTRKTIRQTLGKDFDIRKSLRALVMEKSAKTLTVNANAENGTNDTSVENNEMVESVDDVVEDVAEVQRQQNQMKLESCLQRMVKNAIERKNKVREAVMKSLKAQDTTADDYYESLRRMNAKKPAKRMNRPMVTSYKPSVPIPKELVEDLKYKPPKRFAPRNANWITKRLYKHIETKLEPKYSYRARVRAEEFVKCLYEFTKRIKRHPVAQVDDLDMLKREMARLDIVTTHYDFYDFFHEYMPREVRMKVNPDIVNKLPVPKHIFAEILRPNVIQE